MKVKDLRGRERYLKFKMIDWNAPSKSKFQKACKDILYLYWNGDKVGEEIQLPGSKMRFDFINLNKKIIIEANGEQHYKYNEFFHKKNVFEYVASKERDENKVKFAEINGFSLFEVKKPEEIYKIMLQLEGI